MIRFDEPIPSTDAFVAIVFSLANIQHALGRDLVASCGVHCIEECLDCAVSHNVNYQWVVAFQNLAQDCLHFVLRKSKSPEVL